jgi:hypothetical protein
VIAIGLLACVAAALLTTDRGEGSSAPLEWVEKTPLPDSKTVTVPGGKGQIRLIDAGIRASGTNVSGYELFRSAAVLKIDAGSPVGSARILCSMRAPGGTEVAQTRGSRASYPRSSEELLEQPVPESAVVEFSSHGTDLAVVKLEDAFESFGEEPGVKVEWPGYTVGDERWEWFLPPGSPSKSLELGFASIWRTTAIPSVKIACTLKTSAGSATVKTAGALAKKSEPIAE